MDDTQSIFMETPSRKSLLSLATHASIARDPSAPQKATPAQKESIELDAKLVEWKQESQRLRADLIMEFGQLKDAASLVISVPATCKSFKIKSSLGEKNVNPNGLLLLLKQG
jgi:hypothetical protein